MKDNRFDKPTKKINKLNKDMSLYDKADRKPKTEPDDPCLDCQETDCSKCRYWHLNK